MGPSKRNNTVTDLTGPMTLRAKILGCPTSAHVSTKKTLAACSGDVCRGSLSAMHLDGLNTSSHIIIPVDCLVPPTAHRNLNAHTQSGP